MSETAAKERLNDELSRVVDLPALPATAQKVLSLISDPEVSIEKVKRIISADPALSARILKIANSAFFGGYRNIQNLNQAVLRLGLNSVRNVVVATSMRHVYKTFGLTEKLLWEQMIGSAISSGLIARQTRAADPEDSFIGGLLHDVGKVVLNNEYPDDFARIMERVNNEGVSYHEAEKDAFDLTQRDLGVLVVRKWGFPESIELMIRHFDNHEALSRERALGNLVSVITIADKICQKLGIGWKKPFDNVDFGRLPETLGLAEAAVKDVSEKALLTFGEEISLY